MSNQDMTQNEIKMAASLTQSKYRKKYGRFLVEGIHSVTELLRSPWRIESIVAMIGAETGPEAASIIALAEDRRLPIYRVNRKTFEHIAATESPQGIMAITEIPYHDMKKVAAEPRILIADRIADPGNLGTIARSALAFGFGGLIATIGAADFFNPKVVRATQGAIFHLALAGPAAVPEIIATLRPHHKIYALVPRGGQDPRSITLPARCALIVGAEAAGVDPDLVAASGLQLTIPMPGGAESLNAAVSAAIAMYEFARR